MRSKTPLLDWSEHPARRSDPITSQRAAAKVKPRLIGLRGLFVEGVKRCGGRATAYEAAAAIFDAPMKRESIRKRASECVEGGFVRIVEGAERICSISGNECRVYEVV